MCYVARAVRKQMVAIKDYVYSKYSHGWAQTHSCRAGQTATVTSIGPHRQVLAKMGITFKYF